MTFAILLIAAYLIGAIPFGLLIGLARGVDIRKSGSGNIGATNAGRVLGRKWGFVSLSLDILKGLVPTVIAKPFLVPEQPTAETLLLWVLVGAATVIGHTFPIYLKFRGGKGVATTIGACLGLYPALTIPMIVALIAYAIGRYGTGAVSVGSLALAVVLPVAFFVYTATNERMGLDIYWPIGAIATLLGLLIIVRHRSNVARLLRGEEFSVRGEPSQQEQ